MVGLTLRRGHVTMEKRRQGRRSQPGRGCGAAVATFLAFLVVSPFCDKGGEGGGSGGSGGGSGGSVRGCGSGGGGVTSSVPRFLGGEGKASVTATPHDRLRFHCKAGSDGMSPLEPCGRQLRLSDRLPIRCPEGSKFFVPAWQESSGTFCTLPLLESSEGSVVPCARPQPWETYGITIRKSNGKRDQWVIQMPSKRPPEFDEEVVAYGACHNEEMDRHDPLFFQLTLIPEDPPKRFVIDLDVKASEDEDDFVHVDLYSGTAALITCHENGVTEPPGMLRAGVFCRVPLGEDGVCPELASWESIGVRQAECWEFAAALRFPADLVSPYETKSAFFNCKSPKGVLTKFQIDAVPEHPPRLPHPEAIPKASCHPGSGTDPDHRCLVLVKSNEWAWINCNGIMDSLDPPDINKQNGSFCAVPYETVVSKCKRPMEWSAVLKHPEIHSEGDIFSVAHSGRESLEKAVVAYGRCMASDGRALFFEIQLADREGRGVAPVTRRRRRPHVSTASEPDIKKLSARRRAKRLGASSSAHTLFGRHSFILSFLLGLHAVASFH